MARVSHSHAPDEGRLTPADRQALETRRAWALGFRPTRDGGWVPPPGEGWRKAGRRPQLDQGRGVDRQERAMSVTFDPAWPVPYRTAPPIDLGRLYRQALFLGTRQPPNMVTANGSQTSRSRARTSDGRRPRTMSRLRSGAIAERDLRAAAGARPGHLVDDPLRAPDGRMLCP